MGAIRHVVLSLFLLGLAPVISTGCRSAPPLHRNFYSTNIIITRDNVILLENTKVDFHDLKRELVLHMVSTTSPIVVHVHEKVPGKVFDAVIDKLKDAGFRNLTIVVYGD